MKTFPINTEIQTVKTFSAKPNKIPSAAVTGLVTLRLNTSFVLLPENLMRSRTFDPRVGYFTDNFVEFNDKQQQVKRRSVIARWRLEPKEEDIEKMKRGELVEPKKAHRLLHRPCYAQTMGEISHPWCGRLAKSL